MRAAHETPTPSGDDAASWTLQPAGSGAAWLCADAEPSAELSRRLRARRDALWSTRPRSVHDLVIGYRTLLAEFRAGADAAEVHRWLCAPVHDADETEIGREVEIAVHYGHHADRSELTAATGLAWSDLAERHASAAYHVAFVGFTPGFPYLHGLPEALHVPRRASPAARVPAGAVAIAGGQAGIYPSASPGGWWILGTTDADLFDPRSRSPALLAPGDAVRFVAVDDTVSRTRGDGGRADRDPHAASTTPDRASADADLARAEGGHVAIEVDDVWPGAATLQAGPRWGVALHGMAQAGALDGAARDAAQEIVGAPRRTAAVELLVPVLRARALRPLTIALCGGRARLEVDGVARPTWRAVAVDAGAELRVAPTGPDAAGVTYLALAGGVDAPWRASVHETLARVASTDVRARVGRPLGPGDRLALAGPPATARPWVGRPRYARRAVLRLAPGPAATPRALDALGTTAWRLATRDRTAARLEGVRLHLDRHEVRSEGVPWGAVQVPPDGQPIVLLADRGRTGGYAVPAVVDPRDLWQLAHLGPGDEVWFVPPGWRS